MTGKTRADIALVERDMVESRARAQSLIKAGLVLLNDVPVKKPNQPVWDVDTLTISALEHPWVSRGGMKLAGALTLFDVSVTDMTVLDIGASTGGFTDVVLTNGASKVYAVDVGQGQLAKKLDNDPRVISLEKTNARDLSVEIIPDPIDFLVCDASFISLNLVLPAGLALVKVGGAAIVLIKPQFEVGKGRVGKGGVVKDPALHQNVVDDITTWLDAMAPWSVINVAPSSIEGPDGNIEFVLYAKRLN